MFTIENYFQRVKEIKFTSLPLKLKKGYAYLKEATENYTTWDYYHTHDVIKETVRKYLNALNDHIHKNSDKSKDQVLPGNEKKARDIAKNLIWNYVNNGKTVSDLKILALRHDLKEYYAAIRGNKIYVERLGNLSVNYSFPLQSIYNDVLPEVRPGTEVYTKPIRKEPVNQPKRVQLVERIEEEVKFIKRYAVMEGKKKTDMQILNFINALQKAILDKRIRVHSKYKDEVLYMQTALVNLYNQLLKIENPKKRIAKIQIDKKVLENFRAIGGSEKVRLSVNYLKRYIGIQGKNLTKEKAARLFELIKQAAAKRRIIPNDPYLERLEIIYNSLNKFITVGKKNDTLKVHPGILHGINESLEGIDINEDELGCDCEKKKDNELAGIEPAPEEQISLSPAIEQGPQQQGNVIMNSMDFAKMKFETLGFTGKWLNLIGDPCPGFTAMIFSLPKMGKSYFAIEFAGYLARHHGDSLYVAKEETLHKTLQIKLLELRAQHPSLNLSNFLPEDLTPYQFVFLDSVNTLKLSVEDLLALKEKYPHISFISIHQVTKEGKHRGSMEHQHNVDVIIEIPEKGKVIQFGRFNQGGEMEIFENPDSEQAA